MKEKIENPQAFPREWSEVLQSEGSPKLYAVAQKGMTLRDYLAAKIVNGITSGNMWRSMMLDYPNCRRVKSQTREEYVAMQSYKIADAMLKERSK